MYTFVFRKNVDWHEAALFEKSKAKYDALLNICVIPEIEPESDEPLTSVPSLKS